MTNYNLTDIQTLKDLLKKFRFHTNKDLGQNFLICEKPLKKIIEVANITDKDEIIEIGPGPGVLTQELLKSPAKKVDALEFDSNIIPVLEHVTKDYKNLTIYNVNALKFEPTHSGYLLIANIPYYLTSPILRHYLGNKNAPKRAVLLMQKEVAEKICAKTDDQSILSLEVAIYGEATIEDIVLKDKFFPAPKVNSAILKIEMFDKCLIPEKYLSDFWKITKLAFSQKRKKIGNTLGKSKANKDKIFNDIFDEIGIGKDRRAQTLSVREWLEIVKKKNSDTKI